MRVSGCGTHASLFISILSPVPGGELGSCRMIGVGGA